MGPRHHSLATDPMETTPTSHIPLGPRLTVNIVRVVQQVRAKRKLLAEAPVYPSELRAIVHTCREVRGHGDRVATTVRGRRTIGLPNWEQ